VTFGRGRALVAALMAALLSGAGVAGCVRGVDGPSAPVSPVDGIVTQVEASGLTVVQAFTIRLADGASLRFVVGPLENPTRFPPGHLKEHQASASPIRVYFTASGSTLTAYRLEDAPASSSSP
jgi:hypothetical protein